MLRRMIYFAYGTACYFGFLAVFLYAAAFLANAGVPKTVDSGPAGPLPIALAVNGLLLLVFGLQHSIMARPGFKRVWTRVIPQPIERSTYVLLSNLAMILLFWQWRPMGGVIWEVENPAARAALWTLFGAGWVSIVATSFVINHFDLFGMRQVWLYMRGKPCAPLKFGTPGPYSVIRHPLYVGWITAFWATPSMSAGHLVFAIGTTLYILVAIVFEERDMVDAFGDEYEAYRRRTSRLIPRIGRRRAEAAAQTEG